MKNLLTKDKALQGFYNTFQVGLELEGSFLCDRDELDETLATMEIAEDGSVHSVAEGGEEWELRSDIIKTEEDEKRFLEDLKHISKESNGDSIFAYKNRTAGTHVHIDFTEQAKRAGKFESISLLAFDSLEFERYFFKEYFKRFKSGKFADRLHNSYCKTFLRDVANEREDSNSSVLSSVEGVKAGRERYHWLNTVCLSNNKGIELRIFPYLQTVDGVKQVLDFTKYVIANYWEKPKTKRRARLIEEYFQRVSDCRINYKKLNEYEKILLQALQIDRNPRNQSSDSIEFIMDLHAKKPTAFETNDINF